MCECVYDCKIIAGCILLGNELLLLRIVVIVIGLSIDYMNTPLFVTPLFATKSIVRDQHCGIEYTHQG